MKKSFDGGRQMMGNYTNIERRNSNNDLSKKPDSQQLTSEGFLPTTSDVAKKIQSKLRVRRATGSQKRISKQLGQRTLTVDKMPSQQDFFQEFEQKVHYYWENSESIGKAINTWSTVISPQELKEKIIKEWGVIQCQTHSQEFEEVLLARIERLGGMTKAARRCKEHEEIMGRKFEDRMKKLGELLKSR